MGEVISIVVTRTVINIIDDRRNLSLDSASESDRRDLLKELETIKQLEPHPGARQKTFAMCYRNW